MVFLHHADLLVVQSHLVAVLIDVIDALEEFRVHRDGVAVLREHRHDLLSQGQQFVVAVAFQDVEEHVADAVDGLARLVEGQDGVLEGGRLGVVDNGVNLLELFLHAGLERGHVMLGFDLVERHDLEGGLVFRQERVRSGSFLLFIVGAGCQGDDAQSDHWNEFFVHEKSF